MKSNKQRRIVRQLLVRSAFGSSAMKGTSASGLNNIALRNSEALDALETGIGGGITLAFVGNFLCDLSLLL